MKAINEINGILLVKEVYCQYFINILIKMTYLLKLYARSSLFNHISQGVLVVIAFLYAVNHHLLSKINIKMWTYTTRGSCHVRVHHSFIQQSPIKVCSPDIIFSGLIG